MFPKLTVICYTGIFNVLGLPVTQCPLGFNKEGLPYGIQIVGGKNSDPLTIACAVELEKAFGVLTTPKPASDGIYYIIHFSSFGVTIPEKWLGVP
ncbi:fatty-acid amide hydrolase 2-A [Caerostris darwini]|uniref:Fatty-acid amide hydrolase 2-A n=1 Tax=Caerostris darwini TaxID=1538125 RepID=A0AAV4WCI4_9ARAC|nr:fatty-acid amide hydrolase 2-A [Caerostris darwini]